MTEGQVPKDELILNRVIVKSLLPVQTCRRSPFTVLEAIEKQRGSFFNSTSLCDANAAV